MRNRTRTSHPGRFALVLIVIILGGVGLAVLQLPKLKHDRIASTRTPAPGGRTITLQARKYIVYMELYRASGFSFKKDNPNPLDFETPDVSVQLSPPGGQSLPITTYTGDSDLGSGTVDAHEIGTVVVPTAGQYRMTTNGAAPAGTSDPMIVLGWPLSVEAIVLIVIGGLVALFAFIGLCFTAGNLMSSRSSSGVYSG